MITSIVLCFCIGGWAIGALFFESITWTTFYDVIQVMGWVVSLFAFAAGMFLGLEVDAQPAGQRDPQFGEAVTELQLESNMGSFLGCRPFENKDFALALLRTAAVSSLAAWLIWATVFGACSLSLWMTDQLPASAMPRHLGLLNLPMTFFTPWVAMANLGTIGLSGRGPKLLFTLVTCSVLYCVMFGAISYFTNPLVVMTVHSVCMTIAAAAIVLATLAAYTLARRKQLLATRTVVLVSVTAITILVLAMLLRPAATSYLFYPCAVLYSCLVVLPIATTPLAIAWNRHR